MIHNPFTFQRGQTNGYCQLLSGHYSKDLIPAYTDDLVIDSKYNQSDDTKSTLNLSLDESSEEKKAQLNKFMKTIVEYSEYVIRSEDQEKAGEALRWITDNLALWADSSSLLNVVFNKTGMAHRKWFLACVCSLLMKFEAKYSDFTLDVNVKSWLNKLAEQVVEDYDPRLQSKTKHFNNHDLWAGWAVASWAVIDDNKAIGHWAKQIFDLAMTRVEFHDGIELAAFPIEMARGNLAISYSNYALVPLMFMADTFKFNDICISEHYPALKALAKFAGMGVIDLPDAQVMPSPGKLIWALPYAAMFGRDKLIMTLHKNKLIKTNYSQMGGELSPFY